VSGTIIVSREREEGEMGNERETYGMYVVIGRGLLDIG
jgi:hypothetical protein